MKTLIYLAAPYSSNHKLIIKQRVLAINHAAGHLFHRGLLVFSPISHCHPIFDCHNQIESDHIFWAEYNERMISVCDEFIILTLPGWESSLGVTKELGIAKGLNKQISYMNPITYQVTSFP